MYNGGGRCADHNYVVDRTVVYGLYQTPDIDEVYIRVFTHDIYDRVEAAMSDKESVALDKGAAKIYRIVGVPENGHLPVNATHSQLDDLAAEYDGLQKT